MLRIITDNKWRPFRYSSEVPDKEWISSFDHLDRNEATRFFCYRGSWYSLDEFTVFTYAADTGDFKGWDGMLGQSYFSGILIKISKDGEMYKIGRYMS